MAVLKYFDLGLLPEEPELGKRKRARARKRVLLTLLVYFGIWLGVVGQKLLALHQVGIPLTWENIGSINLLVALVIATTIFPMAVPRVFTKLPARARATGEFGRVALQFCTAFQQGFFWQALLELLRPKL
jgi:hypothetical protein